MRRTSLIALPTRRFRVAGCDPDAVAASRYSIQLVIISSSLRSPQRITCELKPRGWVVSRKRVQRLMREDNLLCVVKRKFVVTTDSAHG